MNFMYGHIKIQMLIMATPILLLTRVILQQPYLRSKVHYWRRKKFMNDGKFLLKVMQFFEWQRHVTRRYPVKFSVHRTCAIGGITFFKCHETTYDHMAIESCDFVRGGRLSQATSLSNLVPMSLVEIEINLFYSSSDSCGHWVVTPYHKPSSCHVQWPQAPRKWKYNVFYLPRDLT